MPSKSAAQRRLMAGAAHDSGFARRVGVPQSVAREFNRADERKATIRKLERRQRRRGGKA